MVKRPVDPAQDLKAAAADTGASTETNSERQFTLEACQINELESKIVRKESDEHERFKSALK